MLKDRALKLLVIQLQRAQDLPISNTGAEGLTFEVSSPTILSPAIIVRPGLSPGKGTKNPRTASQLSANNSEPSSNINSVLEKASESDRVEKKEKVEIT